MRLPCEDCHTRAATMALAFVHDVDDATVVVVCDRCGEKRMARADRRDEHFAGKHFEDVREDAGLLPESPREIARVLVLTAAFITGLGAWVAFLLWAIAASKGGV